MSAPADKTSAETPGKKPRGRPFTGKDDPRRMAHGPGRPPAPKCIADLLRWAGGLDAPEALVAKMREVFRIPRDVPITVDRSCILASRLAAMKGDIRHIEFWATRTEGPPRQVIALEGGTRLEIVEEIVTADAAPNRRNETEPQ